MPIMRPSEGSLFSVLPCMCYDIMFNFELMARYLTFTKGMDNALGKIWNL